MKTKLSRIANLAREKPNLEFTSLAHLLTNDFLKETWETINRKGCSGIDDVSFSDYDKNLDENVDALVDSLKKRSYRAKPMLRIDIPKDRKSTRPLSIPSMEDKLLQKAVARILNSVFDQDFIESSYGFRSGKSAHEGLRDIRKQIVTNKTMWVLEVDIKGYFNHVNHDWLITMIEQRIKDPVIIWLVKKWLKSGVLKDGLLSVTGEGTPQGSPISCILSNIYLHYALDIWFDRIVRKRCQGEAKLFRFVDDFIFCFQRRSDANKVYKVLPFRMKKFNLEIAWQKTKLICFGRFARERMKKRGSRVQSFTFLGFKHVCGRDLKGDFALIRIPSTKSMSKFLGRIKIWLWKHMHHNTVQHQKFLTQSLNGLYAYFGLTHCTHKLSLVRSYVFRMWRRVLSRRSQKGPYKYWSFLWKQIWFNLPGPKVIHNWV